MVADLMSAEEGLILFHISNELERAEN